jgi:hypothetical protein
MTLGLLASGTSGCWSLTGLERLEYQDCLTGADCGSDRQCVAGRCVLPAPVQAGGSGGGAGVPGGSGGDGGTPESCGTNADCVTLHSGAPYLCKNQQCVALTTRDCPDVLGLGDRMENLVGADPIVLGGYIRSSPQPGARILAFTNFAFAVDEFNQASLGGLPGGAGGTRRPVLMVVCQANPSPSDAGVQHLFTTLEVPGIVTSLSPADLNRVFSLATGRVLFVNSIVSTVARATATQTNLLWHMLGSPEDRAPPLAALLARTEAYLRAQRAGTSDETGPLRVTLVESDNPTLTLTAEALYPLLRFNGMNASENEAAGYLRRVGTESAIIHLVGDATDALNDLEAYPPDVILALANQEFAEQVMGRLEVDWATVARGRPRPFYLLSPELVANEAILTNIYFELEKRTVGINPAHYSDSPLYEAYVSRFFEVNPDLGGIGVQGENHYDAAYYLMYSVVAAGVTSGFTGERLAQGFLRIIDEQAPAVDIGPAPLSEQIRLFRDAGHRIQLMGTMGPPNFDLASGTRKVQIGVWCYTSGNPTLLIHVDALRYNDATGQFDGAFPCILGF